MHKCKKHKEICEKLNQIYIDKNTAYGDSFGKMFNDLGIVSAVTQISHKYNRIVALTKGAENNVKDETIEDTLIDLANYAIMTLIEINNSKQMNIVYPQHSNKNECEHSECIDCKHCTDDDGAIYCSNKKR